MSFLAIAVTKDTVFFILCNVKVLFFFKHNIDLNPKRVRAKAAYNLN